MAGRVQHPDKKQKITEKIDPHPTYTHTHTHKQTDTYIELAL